jgi:hypothetical protein
MLPRPAHVHIPDDGPAGALAANDDPARPPQLRARSFVSPNGVNRMSSPDFKCLDRVNGERGYHRIRDLTSLNFPNCCTEVCLRDLPSLEKHAANALDLRLAIKKLVSDVRFRIPPSREGAGACVLAFTDTACAIRCEWADGEAHQCEHLRQPTV